MRVRPVLLLTVTVLAAAVVTAPASASAASPGYIETSTSNPVTAAPAPTVPPTPHCAVSLADHFPSNAADGTPQNYSGTLTPPAACPGPWAKVLLTQTISVSGRQYDRVGSISIGGADVYWGTTEEPSGPTPTTYTVTTDLTDYTALLRTPQPFSGGIGNYVSSVYTGNYVQTVTVTYYRADRRHPAPRTPDRVIGLGSGSANAGTPTVHDTLSDLPRNITRAELSVVLEGAGCDEQWFDDVPDAVSAQYPDAGLCGHGPYREAGISVDDIPAGAVHTFPHIYSGGIVPTLWRPIPAIDTFSLHPETLDLTPFAGRLVDGGTHALSFTIQDAGDSWSVVPTLFLWTDHHAARTHGALTRGDAAASADVHTTTSAVTGGTKIVTTAARHDVTSGWLQTSRGRVTTTVTRTMAYRNTDTVTDKGLTQSVAQRDRGAQVVTSTIGGRVVAGAQDAYDYPITLDYSAADYVDDQNFTLEGTVDMTMRLASARWHRHGWRPTTRSVENVDSYGILSRADGVTSQSDGHSTSYFLGADDRGRPYAHYLSSEHGKITRDVVVRRR